MLKKKRRFGGVGSLEAIYFNYLENDIEKLEKRINKLERRAKK